MYRVLNYIQGLATLRLVVWLSKMARPFFSLYVFIALLMTINTVFALPSDKLQKIFIVADSNSYNYKTGVNIFEGHVKVDQGTTHITADRLITKNNAHHKMQEAIAYGLKETAHYWTLTKVGEENVHAYAYIIKFYPLESNVTLQHHVKVTQGKNSFQGQLILYNRDNETITVPASKTGRAIVVYDPDK